MKKITLLVSSLILIIFPLAYLPKSSNNDDFINNKSEINLTNNSSLYDKEEVYNAFEYNAFQTIQAGKEEKDATTNPDPWITWTELIEINNIDSTNISFDNFESIRFSLSGFENNFIYDAQGTLGNAVADEIQTVTTWGPMVTTEQTWSNKDENGEYTTRITAKEENKDAWINEFTAGGFSGEIAFQQVIDRIPAMHDNPLYNVDIPISSLETSLPFWEDQFVKTNNGYILDYSRTTTYSDGESSAIYNGRNYWDWLNNSFDGIGDDLINSRAMSASSSGVLEYEISLIDSEGTVYGIQSNPSLIAPEINDIVVQDKTKIETNSKESRVVLSFFHDYGNLLNYSIYNIEVKIEDLNNNIIIDWTPFALNETISTDSNNPSLIPLTFKNQPDLFNIGEEYNISIRNSFDITSSTKKLFIPPTLQQIDFQIEATQLESFNTSYSVPWWIWLVVSFIGLFILIGLGFSIFKPIQLIKNRKNNSSKNQ